MKIRDFIKIIFIIICIWVGGFLVGFTSGNNYNKEEEYDISKVEVLTIENERLFDELLKWEDHALRMKRICGVPDTVTWSYKEKVTHCVNLRNLEGR
jgi:hypothetical protein